MATQTHPELTIGSIILLVVITLLVGYFVPNRYLWNPSEAPIDFVLWIGAKVGNATRWVWQKLKPKR